MIRAQRVQAGLSVAVLVGLCIFFYVSTTTQIKTYATYHMTLRHSTDIICRCQSNRSTSAPLQTPLQTNRNNISTNVSTINYSTNEPAEQGRKTQGSTTQEHKIKGSTIQNTGLKQPNDIDADSKTNILPELECGKVQTLTKSINYSKLEKTLELLGEANLARIGYSRLDAHIRDWSFPINVKDCNESVQNMIVLVPSSLDGRETRNIIRATWGSNEEMVKHKSRVVFMIGLTNDQVLQRSIEEEHRLYDDVVQINFYDSYYNLTMKSLGLLHWVQRHCTRPKFVAKIDDDNLVNLKNIINFAGVLLETHGIFITGKVNSKSKPLKKGKWFDPIYTQMYGQKMYPSYCGGPGYVMPNSIVKDLLCSCQAQPYLHLEDVFVTGICAQRVPGLKRVSLRNSFDDYGAACHQLKPGAAIHRVHKYPKDLIIPTWKLYRNNKILCTK